MQELNAVVLYVVIFVPSQFWLASVLNTPVFVRHTARNQCLIRRPGCEDVIFFFVIWLVKLYDQFAATSIVEFQLNNLASKASLI